MVTFNWLGLGFMITHYYYVKTWQMFVDVLGGHITLSNDIVTLGNNMTGVTLGTNMMGVTLGNNMTGVHITQ